MTYGNMLTQMGIGSKQVSDRYAEYHSGPPNEQFVHYAYDAPATHSDTADSKHNYGGGHKSNAAMSALTLLAFLFFLNILQQCLKDHMTAMSTPQFMVMTAGREGEESLAEVSDTNKLDKSGLVNTATKLKSRGDDNSRNKDQTKIEKIKNGDKIEDVNNKILTKINTAHHTPKKNGIRKYVNQSLEFPGFINALYDNKKTFAARGADLK